MKGFVVVSRVGYLLFTTHGKALSVVVLGGFYWNSMSVCGSTVADTGHKAAILPLRAERA